MQLLYRTDATKNMQRFYRLDLQQDLFGVWMLTREWGRIGHQGQTKVTSFASQDDAATALRQRRQQKEKRGYAPELPA